MVKIIEKFARKLNMLQQLGEQYLPGRFIRQRKVKVARESNEAFVVTMPLGFDIWIEPHLYIAKMYIQGNYESDVVRFLKKTVSPGMICIDVGANVGYFALFMSKLTGSKGQVIAFEPTYQTATVLERNRSLNNFSQMEIVQVALSDKNGKLTFNVGKPGYEVYNTVGTVAHPSADPDAFVQVSIPCITLDSYLSEKRVDHIDLIKIDVEGSELAALQGMEQTLSQNQEATLLIEFSDVTCNGFDYSASDMQQWLVERGWQLRIIGPFATLTTPETDQIWRGQMVAARQQWED